jgi:hypothetical protein
MFLLVVFLLLAAFMLFVVWQRQRLARANTQRAREMLEQRRPVTTIATTVVTPVASQHLPAPIQRYLEHVLVNTTPITALQASQQGTFDLNNTWQPFRATHTVTINPPGFCWTAGIRAGIGVDAQVVDSYSQQRGGLEAHLLGAFKIMSVQNNTPTNTAELMRYLAEMPWYPTAFLAANIRWHDERHDETADRATATLTDGEVEATVTFVVNDANEISHIDGQRYKGTDDDALLEQWRGRFWDYQLIDGVRIPKQGEVMWLADDGEHPYWRGTLEAVTFYRDSIY